MVFKGLSDDPQEEDKPAPGGDVFLTIAANDTPATLKDRADYTCDGTSTTGGDQVEINTALGIADVVTLCPGTYWIDDRIIMATGKSLIGGGSGCVIKIMDAKNADLNMITNSDFVGGNDHIVIRNLMLDGNKANNGSGVQRGVYFYKVSPWAPTTPGSKIEGCFIENFRRAGIELHSCYRNSLIGNTIFENAVYGIYLMAENDGIIIGNDCRGSICGIVLESCNNDTVIGNNCYNNTHGIFISSNAHWNTITGNTIYKNTAHGIWLLSSHNNNILGNSCLENSYGTDVGYDNIFLASSDYNLIVGNVCRRGTQTNRPRYGINISNDACDRNCLIGNDLYDSGSTGDLNDVPTTNPTLKHDNRNLAGTGWLAEV